MNKRILVESHPNSRGRTFHVNRVLSGSAIENFWRPLRDSSERILKTVGEPGANIVRSLLRLPGVTEIFIKPYELSVYISDVHDWDSLEPSVIRVLCNEVFHEDRMSVQIDHK